MESTGATSGRHRVCRTHSRVRSRPVPGPGGASARVTETGRAGGWDEDTSIFVFGFGFLFFVLHHYSLLIGFLLPCVYLIFINIHFEFCVYLGYLWFTLLSSVQVCVSSIKHWNSIKQGQMGIIYLAKSQPRTKTVNLVLIGTTDVG